MLTVLTVSQLLSFHAPDVYKRLKLTLKLRGIKLKVNTFIKTKVKQENQLWKLNQIKKSK